MLSFEGYEIGMKNKVEEEAESTLLITYVQ